MSQHDFDIANQSASSARADINNALKALASLSSGPSAPSTTYANMVWYDTVNNTLKVRSEADDAWISLGYLNQSTDTFALFDDTQVVNTSGTQTGLLGDQTTATWEAGTGTTESLVSPAKLKAAIDASRDFSPVYESSEEAWVEQVPTVVSHGLGRRPYHYQVVLRCKTSELGYAVGDEVDVTGGASFGNGASWTSTTQIGFVSSNNQLGKKADGQNAAATESNWRLIFRAW